MADILSQRLFHLDGNCGVFISDYFWFSLIMPNTRVSVKRQLAAVSGQTRISYNDAVEEALCFGWIDSQVKGSDSLKYAQRFSPRRPGVSYSQANRERLKSLLAILMGHVIASRVSKTFGLFY